MSWLDELNAILNGGEWAVVRFRDVKHNPGSPPHFYVAVPISGGQILLLCMVTSKVTEKLAFYTRSGAQDGCARLFQTDIVGLTQGESLIDCNQPLIGAPVEIAIRIDLDHGMTTRARESVAPHVRARILRALHASKMVSPKIKSILPAIPSFR